MVPLLPSYTYADFARVVKLPLIVVAANRLGDQPSAADPGARRCKALNMLGYVLNQYQPHHRSRPKPIVRC